ncbi:hypothetical protein HO173_002536 [Letharia columbiana]|uniref:Methyltransferase type 12 domain-containing protein n=1 Tax=Letharia columbiana TaxID=112416 RepID=A0A8H6L8B5_9LECA|nr:uncharacterized protein HO173_002536 [Letharia columbiana]KAF6239275.1 hypothetical protein HO173_002536 [Letharia columbiana]
MNPQASPLQLAKSIEGKPPIRFLDPTTAYNLWSEVYDTDGNFLQALDTIEMRSLVPKMVSRISSSPPWKVVDLGCGTGRNMTRLLDLPCSMVVGLDASSKMLEIAKLRINEHMSQISRASEGAQGARLEPYNLLGSYHIPSCALNADALISTLVLEHVPLSIFFEKASELLKPSGLALVTNMHSDMGAISQAGFVDPKTGEKVQTQSFAHHLNDVVAEAQKQGFEVVGEVLQRAVDEEMSEVLGMRARKWIGVTVWFGVCFRKQA